MFLVHGNWRGGRLYPILQFPALGLMQLLKLQYTEKMSRFRWSGAVLENKIGGGTREN